MISHITLGINNFSKAEPFYDAIMEILEWPIFDRMDNGKCYGELMGSKLFIGPAYNGEPATYGNGTHVAFLAKTRKQVDDFHDAAMRYGGSDEGMPGLRPQYLPNYYGAYVRDPEGNKLQAVCYRSE